MGGSGVKKSPLFDGSPAQTARRWRWSSRQAPVPIAPESEAHVRDADARRAAARAQVGGSEWSRGTGLCVLKRTAGGPPQYPVAHSMFQRQACTGRRSTSLTRDGWRVAWNAARWKSWFVEDRGVRKAKAQGGTIHDARSGVTGVSPACGRLCVLWFVWDEVEEETGVGRGHGGSPGTAETGARVAVSLDYFMCGGRECVCYCFLSSLISALLAIYISSRNARAIRIPGRSFPLDVPP